MNELSITNSEKIILELKQQNADLLEALKMFLAWFESLHAGREVLIHAAVKARAAIAKVEA